MTPIYTSIDPTKDKALFKNQRIRKPKKPKKDEKRNEWGSNNRRGANR